MSESAAPNFAVKQSTLTYTLLENEKISWEEFSIIVRSLHHYEVISINEAPESKTITVTVGYFANVGNARLRLGDASEFIDVSRESSNIKKEELQTLQHLRRKFKFGRSDEIPEPSTSKSSKRRRYANCN